MSDPLKSPQQEKFAQSVASGMSLSDAYRAAYKTGKMKPEAIWVEASKLAANPMVTLRVSEFQAIGAEKAGLKSAEILEEVRRLALSDIGGIMHADGRVKMPHELDKVTRAAVSSFKIDEYGRIEYKFWDKNASIDKAMKHLGLFEVDNKQKTDPLIDFAKTLRGDIAGPGTLQIPEDDD
jgi:phage terminase small subunit